MPLRRPGRLPNVSYIGIQRYYLTLCTMDRRTEFEIHDVVEYGKFQLLHFGRKHAFAILAYCFMPDHLCTSSPKEHQRLRTSSGSSRCTSSELDTGSESGSWADYGRRATTTTFHARMKGR